MFLIFGFGRRKVRDNGPVVACTCPHCHNEVSLSHLLVTTWFTLFFLPVIPYGRKQLLVCPICKWAMPVTKANAPAIDEMSLITKSWRAGQLTNEDYGRRIDAFWAHFRPAAEPAA